MKNSEDLSRYDYLDSIEGFQPFDRDHKAPLWPRAKSLIPGVMVCAVVALAAGFIASYYTAPVMLLGLLLGMVFHFMSQESPTGKGVQFTSQTILRFGVALIGARIMLSDFTALGWPTLILVIMATGGIILLGVFWAWALRLDREQGLLIGGATAICGASAALALSTVMPKSKTLEHNTLIAVIGVTAMGTISMIIYPVIVGFLAIDSHDAGILIGGTIHDVSQVVGAGYSISGDAGDTAILVKLIRVFMLVPILLIFALSFRSHRERSSSGRFIFPYFLVGFIALVMLNSLQLIPAEISGMIQLTSKWMLVMAITAVGMKTSLKAMFSLGWKPLFLIVIETLTLSILYFSVIAFEII
ncbi:Inner membrane protein [hydrothermal vent metagenome]|uniref:Inner membrane protein n=1 Tax=hydrothermal vent metagenome TaxID=652676 RepID=A0A3B0SPZ3_9ZZZZ